MTLPWVLPVLLAAMLLRTIWVANDFDLIYLLAFGGPLGATTTVPIAIRSLAFSDQNVGLASSLAIVAAAFLLAGARLLLLVPTERAGSGLAEARRFAVSPSPALRSAAPSWR